MNNAIDIKVEVFLHFIMEIFIIKYPIKGMDTRIADGDTYNKISNKRLRY